MKHGIRYRKINVLLIGNDIQLEILLFMLFIKIRKRVYRYSIKVDKVTV